MPTTPSNAKAEKKLVDAAEYALIQLQTMQGMWAAELNMERREQLGAKKRKEVEFQIDNSRFIKLLERALKPYQTLGKKKK